ncbi:MAG: hypothetical protein AAB600_05180 [Patescibacteria group bacterium]
MGKILVSLLIIFEILAISNLNIQKTYARQVSASANLQPSVSYGKLVDSRVKVLKNFLEKYNAPFVPFAGEFIKSADVYNLDWKLVAAISGVESTFGKFIPYDSFNAWGWGVYGNNVIYFSSWTEGIETVSKGLRENYLDKWGAKNIHQIGKIYAASPTWASKVEYFMEKITEFENQNLAYNLPISL